MSANTIVYVQVLKVAKETIAVSAITLQDAEAQAAEMEGVVSVVGSAYDLENLPND